MSLDAVLSAVRNHNEAPQPYSLDSNGHIVFDGGKPFGNADGARWVGHLNIAFAGGWHLHEATIADAQKILPKVPDPIVRELVAGCRAALALLEANHEAWHLKPEGPVFTQLRALVVRAEEASK
jgi:hypothetical protein